MYEEELCALSFLSFCLRECFFCSVSTRYYHKYMSSKYNSCNKGPCTDCRPSSQPLTRVRKIAIDDNITIDRSSVNGPYHGPYHSWSIDLTSCLPVTD